MIETKPERLLNLSYLLGGGEDPPISYELNILGMDNCFEVARLCGVGWCMPVRWRSAGSNVILANAW